MKKIAFVLIFHLSLAIVSGQSSFFNITGNIAGAENIQLFLQVEINGRFENIDTSLIRGGKFAFKKGSVAFPQVAYLQANNNRFLFFIENREINISGSFSDFVNLKVSGSKTQDEYDKLKEEFEPVYNDYLAKSKEYQAARSSGDNKKADELLNQLKDMPNRMTNMQKEFIVTHPSSYVVPVLLQGMADSMTGSELEAVIKVMDPSVAKTPVVAEIKARSELLSRVELGKKAPDFTMNNLQGKPVSLNSLTGKKIILVDFWAAWCRPCREENPNVVKVYNEFKDKGFDILGVSLDRSASDWNKAVIDDKLDWNHVSDLKYWDNAAAKIYGVSSIPANFLLDKNGIIIAKNLRGQALYNKVKELLGSSQAER